MDLKGQILSIPHRHWANQNRKVSGSIYQREDSNVCYRLNIWLKHDEQPYENPVALCLYVRVMMVWAYTYCPILSTDYKDSYGGKWSKTMIKLSLKWSPFFMSQYDTVYPVLNALLQSWNRFMPSHCQWLTLKFSHKWHIQFNSRVIMTFFGQTNKKKKVLEN